MTKKKAAGSTRRERYEAQQRRRSLIIAASSTLAVLAAIIVFVPMAPGWEKVQRSFFNADVLAQTFPRLVDAFLVNVMIFAWCAPAIAILGLSLIHISEPTRLWSGSRMPSSA